MSSLASRRPEITLTLVILSLTALAWVLTVYQAQTMTCGMCRGMSITCPMCLGRHLPLWKSLSSFSIMWSTMMAAMMLPSIIPMVLLFRRVTSQRSESGAPWLTGFFTSGYLAAWASLGFLAFAAARGVQFILLKVPALDPYHSSTAAITLLVAGLYQLSPYKNACLRRCQSPLDFLLENWREGPLGALQMGIRHGFYCIGCCAGLMMILFAVGLMNLAWMAGLTVLMTIEKVSPWGLWIGRAAGISLLLLGGAKLFANL